MAAKEIAVKRYVVYLSDEERERLAAPPAMGDTAEGQRRLRRRHGRHPGRLTRPRDPDRPLVCLDETSKQLVAETRAPIPMKAGRPARSDYEYKRNGTANLFMLFAPLEGWRHVEVTDRHAAVDYATVLKNLADIHFASAGTIVLVRDNLSVHGKASLYTAFPAAEARRLVERFEWHYTPKHRSWLNLAESELGVLTSQCLDRRIPDKPSLIEEVAAWENDRNRCNAKADWHFTTKDARIKLKHL